MIDGHSFNFLAIESGPSNPPHAGRHNEERGGKKCKRAKRNFTLSTCNNNISTCFLSLSLSHTHTFPLPSNQCFFSNFSCLKFGEILPKISRFFYTRKKKPIKKIPNFFVEK
jgi:hypothetical protein